MAERRKPRTMAQPPAAVPVAPALLEAVRAACPPARDWTDSQVTAACLALTIKRTAQ